MRRVPGRLVGILSILALVPANAAAPAADFTDASVRHLRRAATSQRDGSHLPRLFALRQLADPTLRPLFVQLVQSQDWQTQVHAALGLAEVDPQRRIDPWLVTQVDRPAQEALIANALDMEMLPSEQIRELLAWEELEPLPRLLLWAELASDREEVDVEELSRLAGSPNYRIAALASMLLAQQDEPAAFSAFTDRLATLLARDRNRHVLWVLEAVRQYRLTSLFPWVRELLAQPDLDDEVAYWSVFTAIVLDPEAGLPLWDRALGTDPPYRDRVRFGLLLLAAGSSIPPDTYDRLGDDTELVGRMSRAGHAMSTGQGRVRTLQSLLDLGHLKSTSWIMDTLPSLPPDEAADVYEYLIASARRESDGRAERIARAIEASARLFEIRPARVVRLLAEIEDDSISQEVVLLGLFDSSSASVGDLVRDLRRIGAGRADSLVLLLIARHDATLNTKDLERLGLIAAGGGRVSEGLQVQAAWLYLKHAGRLEQALNAIFSESP